MKKNLMKACIIATISLSVMACQKNESDASTELKIDASKTTAKVGESVTIQVKNAASDLVAEWKASPATSVNLSEKYSVNQKNTVSFSTAGTYTITADLKKGGCNPGTSGGMAAWALGMDSCMKLLPIQSSTSVKIIVIN